MDLNELLGIDPHSEIHRLADLLVEEDDNLLNHLVALRRASCTQDEVAARMGVSQSAVARIESGDRDPRLSTLRRYAHAVGAIVTHTVRRYDHAAWLAHVNVSPVPDAVSAQLPRHLRSLAGARE